MKSSFGKLKKLALQKGSESKEKPRHHHQSSTPHSNDLAQATLDMQDMRNCYDSLLSAAAATANSAYEFSESLRDMGTCFQAKTALNDDEESGNLLSMLGNVQFELQKLVDCYRSHVNLTITKPSESLLNELYTVEEMKRQCDEKRSLYEDMVTRQREKGRSKSGKMEDFSSQHIQAACGEYNEEATLCVFRLKSLKQGQCHSLITQAARHHAAQLNFFRKGLKSLEAVEPHMRLVAEKQHIDYELPELGDGEDDGGNSFGSYNDGELSFEYRTHKQGHEAVLASRSPMRFDHADIPRLQASTNAESMNRERRQSSYSAPLFAEKLDSSERVRETQTSTSRKSYSYVLPTPDDAKGVVSARNSKSSASQSRQMKHSGSFHNLAPLSQLESQTQEKAFTDDNLSLPPNLKAQLKKELSNNNLTVQLPPTLVQGISRPHFDANNMYDANNTYDDKNVKRQAFSGPLTGKSSTNKPGVSVSGPINHSELPQLVTGLLSKVPTYKASYSSSKVSPTASPPIVSSPRISELHELPRPPDGLASKAAPSPSIGHSAPLVYRNQEPSLKNRSSGGAFSNASPLPTPPFAVSRSYSIPSTYQRSPRSHVAKLLEPSQHTEMSEEVDSPPLTPISLSKIKLLPNVSEMATDTVTTKGKS